MIPNLLFPLIVRANEKFRIDASGSVIPPILPFPVGTNEVNSVIVTCGAGGPSFEIFNEDRTKWFLDYAFALEADYEIQLQITDAASNTVSIVREIQVVDADADIHFCSDLELQELEPEILGYLPDSNNNYNYAHRGIRSLVINWLMLSRVWKRPGQYYQAQDIANILEVKELARYWTLEWIYKNLSNKNDDHFFQKSNVYKTLREKQQSITLLTLRQTEITEENEDGSPRYVETGSLTMKRGNNVTRIR
jgi:hypothetical protein